MPKTINIIGAGKVGKVFAKRWHQQHTLTIQHVVCRQLNHAQHAVNFIGAGIASNDLQQLLPADISLLSVPDDSIKAVATQLASLGMVQQDNIVIHCSGALSSEILQPLQACGARTLSMHPPFSFADAEYAVKHLSGISCVLEGEATACAEVQQLLQAINLHSVKISAHHKMLYHSALVMVSNYLVSLLDMGGTLLKQLHIADDEVQALMQPLVQGVVNQTFASTPQQALTGPIDRAETDVIKNQLHALQTANPDIFQVYKALGRYTVQLAQCKHQWPKQLTQKLENLFNY